MDPTPACRDRCASSADQLSCLRDCVGSGRVMSSARAGPVNPLYSVPKMFTEMSVETRGRTFVYVAAVAALLVGGVWLYKRQKRSL